MPHCLIMDLFDSGEYELKMSPGAFTRVKLQNANNGQASPQATENAPAKVE